MLKSRFLPVAISTLICWGIVFGLCLIAMSQMGWTFVYPLDDTYIHMDLARTLASHHVWGINAYEFGSASSSPGWTFLLALCALMFGSHLLTPLILNLLLIIPLMIVADAGLRFSIPGISILRRTIGLLAVVLLTPLPSLVLISMEHVGQTLGVFAVVIFGTQILSLSPGDPLDKRRAALLIAAAFLTGAMRYEAVFTIAAVCFCLFLRRRVGLALLVGLASALVPAGFGLYSHHVSGFWLPFSVEMKKSLDHRSLADHLRAMQYKRLDLVALLTFFARSRSRRFFERTQILGFLTCLILFQHMIFAPAAFLMRYESYVIALFFFYMAVALLNLPPVSEWSSIFGGLSGLRRGLAVATAGAVVILLVAFSARAFRKGLLNTERACVDRYHEHIQMARFVADYYDHSTVVVNDIGAVGYYSNAHLLDFAGLASAKPVQAIARGNPLSAAEAAGWVRAQGAELAVIQESWTEVVKLVPRSWIHVTTWYIPRNVVFGDRGIAIYVAQPKDLPRICANLAAFPLPPADQVVMAPGACPAKSSSASGAVAHREGSAPVLRAGK